MAEQLSGVTVVIIIACGVLTFILFFLFAKRQIMRFALRSRRGPHVPIGHGAKKVSYIQMYMNFLGSGYGLLFATVSIWTYFYFPCMGDLQHSCLHARFKP